MNVLSFLHGLIELILGNTHITFILVLWNYSNNTTNVDLTKDIFNSAKVHTYENETTIVEKQFMLNLSFHLFLLSYFSPNISPSLFPSLSNHGQMKYTKLLRDFNLLIIILFFPWYNIFFIVLSPFWHYVFLVVMGSHMNLYFYNIIFIIDPLPIPPWNSLHVIIDD